MWTVEGQSNKSIHCPLKNKGLSKLSVVDNVHCVVLSATVCASHLMH